MGSYISTHPLTTTIFSFFSVQQEVKCERDSGQETVTGPLPLPE